jgi:hypothetical protein
MHLTKIRRIPHLRWDRPAHEIEVEITREMEEAGAEVIACGDLDYESLEDIAVDTFRAMLRQRRITVEVGAKRNTKTL